MCIIPALTVSHYTLHVRPIYTHRTCAELQIFTPLLICRGWVRPDWRGVPAAVVVGPRQSAVENNENGKFSRDAPRESARERFVLYTSYSLKTLGESRVPSEIPRRALDEQRTPCYRVDTAPTLFPTKKHTLWHFKQLKMVHELSRYCVDRSCDFPVARKFGVLSMPSRNSAVLLNTFRFSYTFCISAVRF